MLLCTYGHNILILRPRNRNLTFSVSILRFFIVCAVKHSKDYSTKLDIQKRNAHAYVEFYDITKKFKDRDT